MTDLVIELLRTAVPLLLFWYLVNKITRALHESATSIREIAGGVARRPGRLL